MTAFVKRNLLVFFRDKSAVFFSMLSVLIIIGLYVLFLGDVWSDGLGDVENADLLMKTWVMAGLLAVTSITTTMGALGTMVEDKARRIYKDFYSAPVSRSSISGGYLLGAFTVGLIMTLLTYVLAEVYLVLSGAPMPSIANIAETLGFILLSNMAGTTMVFCLVSIFKSLNAYGTASTIIGTLIGFLTGIYLPIGTLPEAVQTVVKVFPISHAASLIRESMMRPMIDASFANVPAQYVREFEETMGVVYRFGDTTVTELASIIILAATAVIFFVVSTLIVSKKKR